MLSYCRTGAARWTKSTQLLVLPFQRSKSSAPAESKLIAAEEDSQNVVVGSDVRSSAAGGTPFDKLNLEFDSPEEAYKSKSFTEILRALAVFKLCQFDILVNKNKEILKLSRRLLGKRLFNNVMQATFYGHFVAGADQPSIQPIITKLESFGVGAILDYGVEEDIPHNEAVVAEMESCVSEADKKDPDIHNEKFKAYPQFADRRKDVSSARTYFYKDEHKCDQNLQTLLQCVDASGASSENGFAAVKLTALGRPQLLLNLSEVLTKTRNLFVQFAGTLGNLKDRKLTKEQFEAQLQAMGIITRDNSGDWFTWMDYDQDGKIDLLEWEALLQPNHRLHKIFKIPNFKTGKLEPLLISLPAEEEAQMKSMLHRINKLAKRAEEKNVRLMIDAEQSYFQPAISRLTIEMMRKFNKKKPVIFNTYQCYLKEAFNNLTVDMTLAKREGFYFGAKLVRGAYMDQERKRASEIGYEDPINPNYDSTDAMYHQCLGYILKKIQSTGGINVMVASHNEDTVRRAVELMNELGIGPKENLVYFGQLLGMCDQVSFPLGQAGYSVYKYVPYGPVEEVLPYLSRRALENRGMLKGVEKERSMLWTEVKRRTAHRS
ncbi:proline dehydrogenase 1, mitochondrial-like [Antedon mediterranea]|uniref:proline dehydrogenase 1, mitochondrial-like n=1 Tax=Antedon mediterranea TaxID=105859 RepID=UPI003AF8AC19